MRILTWNILHGGGARRMPGIVLNLLEHRAEVIVLTEFRTRMGGQLAGVLADHGWVHQLSSNPRADRNGLLLLSKLPVDPGPCPLPEQSRGLSARVGDDLFVTAVHIPDARASDHHAVGRKAAAWVGLLDHASTWRNRPHLIIGDFNTGRHLLDERESSFTSVAQMGKLSALGYRDAYRICHPKGRDFSWKSHVGTPFRLDHAFVSSDLSSCVESVSYSHREREEGLSDHAAMIVELALEREKMQEMTKDTEKTGESGLQYR